MTNVYTQNRIINREKFDSHSISLVTIVSARVRPEESVLDMKLREYGIGKQGDVNFNSERKKLPQMDCFSVNSAGVYMELLRQLGVDYNSEEDGKDITQVRGKHIFTYSEEGKIIAVQLLKNEYPNSRPINLMSRKKTPGREDTEYLHAYAMHDMGEGEIWLMNEITVARCILPDGRYKQRTSKIKKAEYDEHRGELELKLKKRSLHSDYTFILFNESSINLFLREYAIEGIGKIKELEGKKITVLFTDSNYIDWVIPYIEPVKKENTES